MSIVAPSQTTILSPQLPQRDIDAVHLTAIRYLVTPEIYRREVYTGVDPRISRDRLNRVLVPNRFLNRYPKSTADPRPPYYYLGPRGPELLATVFNDPAYLAKPTNLLCRADHLKHTEAVGEVLHRLQKAVGGQALLTMPAAYHEFEPVNPLADSANWRRLRTEIEGEVCKLICMPDFGMLLDDGQNRVVVLGEIEIGNTSWKQACRRKWKGYAAMARQELHREVFPTTTTRRFTVLMICPSALWRDQFAKQLLAVTTKHGEPNEATYWRLVAVEDAIPEKLLHAPVVRRTDRSDLVPLIATPPG